MIRALSTIANEVYGPTDVNIASDGVVTIITEDGEVLDFACLSEFLSDLSETEKNNEACR